MDAAIFSYEIAFNTKDWIKIMIYDIAQTISIITNIIIIIIISGYVFFIIIGAIELANRKGTRTKEVISFLFSQLILYPLIAIVIIACISTLIITFGAYIMHGIIRLS